MRCQVGSALDPLGNDPQIIVERFKPMLVGQDPLARERICQRMANWSIGGILRGIGVTAGSDAKQRSRNAGRHE